MIQTAPRGSLGWAGALLAGAMSAAAFAFAFQNAETMLIFLAYLAALPLFVAGLGAGTGSAIAAAITGTATVYAVNPNISLTVAYALFNALPSVMLTFMALRTRANGDGNVFWYPEGYLITAMALYPCLVFLGMVALMAGQEGGLLGQTQQMLQTAFEPFMAELEPEMTGNVKAALEYLPGILPAAIGSSWMFLMLISMVFAQSTLKQQNWHLRPSMEWLNMHIPSWVLIAAAATGLAGWFAPIPYSYVAGNICAMLCVTLFLAGIAVVHAFAKTQRAAFVILLVFYAMLTFFPWLSILVALLGALDQVFRFRQRLPQKSHNQGENT